MSIKQLVGRTLNRIAHPEVYGCQEPVIGDAGIQAVGLTFDVDPRNSYPPAVDWRARGYVTPVRKQRNCGRCVAFGVIAAVEACMRVKYGKSLNVDLSESHLFNCPTPGIGAGSCVDGWWPTQALEVLRIRGVTADKYFPSDTLTGCTPKSGWYEHMTKIYGWGQFASINAAKRWMSIHGPIITRFSIYKDFNAYRGGIYTCKSTEYVTGHCVCVVGYDEAKRYWLCKNSMGPNWGDKGYFKIGYGQCDIERYMWGATV